MNQSDHAGKRKYSRKVFKNLTEHICVQCQGTGAIVRMPEHGNKLWLKPEDVAKGKKIIPFDEGKYEQHQLTQGELLA